jgi:hypothetical protein
MTSATPASALLTTVHFLRKERLYTKLKYSRCPQYDIVSGGIAALFSAFLGFLISERFGLELLDSGDFYFAFMYGVFLVCSVRPLVRLLGIRNGSRNPLTPLYLLDFYTNCLVLCSQYYKCFFVAHSNYIRFWLGRLLE